MEKYNEESKTYFVVSDIHGFYDELIEGLNRAGYKKDNPNHVLVVVGDIFDRGPQNLYVYKFLKNLPKDRRVLIRGNHEDMFLKLINKPFPDYYDFSNRTVSTFCQLAGFNESTLYNSIVDDSLVKSSSEYWAQIVQIVKMLKVDEWIMSNDWVNYFEIDDYVFVHSFIPIRNGEYNPSWRTDSTKREWVSAQWSNPHHQYWEGLFSQEEAKGKKIVFGHWHTSDIKSFINNSSGEFDTGIVEYKGFLAIDGGVKVKDGKQYHPVNVLVIKENSHIKYDG
jgi:hypothetical protein